MPRFQGNWMHYSRRDAAPTIRFTLSLQKSEGSRVKATGGEAVVGYCEPPATQNLESSGFPAGEKRWHQIDPILKFTIALFLQRRFNGL